jgi:hypothetical protein
MKWSKVKKIWETEFLHESLRGRVEVFQTNYRKSHDQGADNFRLVLDGETVFTGGCYLRYFSEKSKSEHFCSHDMSRALRFLFENSIEDALNMEVTPPAPPGSYGHKKYDESDVVLIRAFALFDKRCGSRRLNGFTPETDIEKQFLTIRKNV